MWANPATKAKPFIALAAPLIGSLRLSCLVQQQNNKVAPNGTFLSTTAQAQSFTTVCLNITKMLWALQSPSRFPDKETQP